MLAGLRVESVVEDGVGSLQRGRGFDRRVADTHLAVIADAQLASHLKRDSGEGLVRAHGSSSFMLPPASPGVCALSREGAARVVPLSDETPDSGVVSALLEIWRTRTPGA